MSQIELELTSAIEDVESSLRGETCPTWHVQLEAVPAEQALGGSEYPRNVAEAAMTLIRNIPSCKYLFSIAVTACVKKAVDPSQDIRIAQRGMPGGYSNRSLDEREVTPFLKRHGLTHCQASGLESGRNLERPIPWDLSYQCAVRGRGNREAFLALMAYLESPEGLPKVLLRLLILLDASNRQTLPTVSRAKSVTSLRHVTRLLSQHIDVSVGQGRSRVPVLAVYASLQTSIDGIPRYRNHSLKPLERHTTADLRSGAIGDIEIASEQGVVEGFEIKSEKPITADMVRALHRKFAVLAPSRYTFLTTNPVPVLPMDMESVEQVTNAVELATGCEIFIQTVDDFIMCALKWVSHPSATLEIYSELLATDDDIRPNIIEAWNSINNSLDDSEN